jgi:hypothetical protein
VTPGDRLLYTLSARGDLSWASFKKFFELLCTQHLALADLEDANLARYEAARALDALGHIELDLSSSPRIYAAPPTLVLLPNCGFPEAVFAGARAPASIEKWQHQARQGRSTLHLEIHLQEDKSRRFPSRISVKAETREELRIFAAYIGVSFQDNPASWRILNFAGSLSQLLAGNEWQRSERLNWEEREFSPEELRFSATQSSGETKLIKYIHPSRQYPVYFLWKGSEATRIDPDWGRFAILSGVGRNVIHYERCGGTLILPVSIPLPRILARALCLCSGSVPRLIPGSSVLHPKVTSTLMRLYANIPPEFAQMIAEKLDQKLITDLRLLETEND